VKRCCKPAQSNTQNSLFQPIQKEFFMTLFNLSQTKLKQQSGFLCYKLTGLNKFPISEMLFERDTSTYLWGILIIVLQISNMVLTFVSVYEYMYVTTDE